jgi:hypothetical protein
MEAFFAGEVGVNNFPGSGVEPPHGGVIGVRSRNGINRTLAVAESTRSGATPAFDPERTVHPSMIMLNLIGQWRAVLKLSEFAPRHLH